MARAGLPIHYTAFISYRHMPHDRHWAMRILQKIEAFRTPRSLQKQGFPDRLGTVFRDEDEIPASTDLTDQIKQALRQSDLLVVICSADTPQSRWVRREIELFQELGKGDKIIPVLISGEPDTSFPPELLRRKRERASPEGVREEFWEDIEPVAADVRPRAGESPTKTEQRAILRIASAALGCRFDDLAQREATQRQRWLRNVGAMTLLAAGLLIGTGWWWWDTNLHVKTAYYNNFSERWGAPSGVGPVDGETAKRLGNVYKLSSKAGRVVEMERVNGSGGLVSEGETPYEGEDWTKGTARWSFSYRENGTLASVTMFSQAGKNLRELQYRFSENKRSGVLLFERSLGQSERQAAGATALSSIKGDASGRRGSIGQHRLTFDGAGFIIERWFEPLGGGASTPDAVGAYGRRYGYSAEGLVISLRNLDAVGDTLIEKSGVAEIRRDFDAMGRLRQVEWHTKIGDLTTNDVGVARVLIDRDSDGRPIASSFQDASGHATLRKDGGLARTTRTYDSRGNEVEQAYFDVDGKPVLRRDLGASRITWAHDARGNKIEEAYADIDGQPALNKDTGVARSTSVYDTHGNLVEGAYFGIDGKPVFHKSIGAARFTSVYDALGNWVEEDAFGVDGQPVLRKDTGAGRLTLAYDARGNQVEEAYFGIDGHLVLRKDLGAARITWVYDARGNRVEKAYFGIDGKPVLSKDTGAARIAWAYDARGNTVETTYFGIDAQPKLSKDIGAARLTWVFDARGNIIEEAYFGIDGKPALRKALGVARIAWVFDARGNKVEGAYFGIDGQRTLSKDIGAARFSAVYDVRGNQVEEAYFGVDDKPVLRKNIGAARFTLVYDARGNQVEAAYFGIDGKPVLRDDIGAARIALVFDARGNKVEEAYFGIDGKPVLRKDNGAARLTWVFDPRDNIIEQGYFGVDGKPMLGKDFGAARITQVFDARGNWIEAAYFGTEGEPVMRSDQGYSKISLKYDSMGKIIEELCYDTEGALAPNAFGFAQAKARWDSLGRMLEERYFDRQGKPVLRANRLRKGEDIEDLFGRWASFVLSGALDKAAIDTIGSGGFARIEQDFDSHGRATRRAFFGVNGEPAPGLNGVPEERVEYDDYYRPVLFRPIIGESTTDATAQIWTRVTYDAAGDVTRIDYVAPDGHIVSGKQGYASVTIVRGADGSVVSTARLDADGNSLAQ